MMSMVIVLDDDAERAVKRLARLHGIGCGEKALRELTERIVADGAHERLATAERLQVEQRAYTRRTASA